MIDQAELGVQIGEANVGVSTVADDILGMTDQQDKLQCILDLASFYGDMYHVRYGADKTKVVISGPEIDRKYYCELKPWVLYGERVEVVENNEHLGQVISGDRQTGKNIDRRIMKGRQALFGLLGSSYKYQCKISPAVKLHIYRTIICPTMISGLSTFYLKTRPEVQSWPLKSKN